MGSSHPLIPPEQYPMFLFPLFALRLTLVEERAGGGF